MSKSKDVTDRQGLEHARLARSKGTPRDLYQRAHDDGTMSRVLDAIKAGLPITIGTKSSGIIGDIEAGLTEQWLHPDQVRGVVTGHVIYAYLKENNLLDGCIDEDELKAIQAKGIEFYRKHYAGKALFAWKSVRDGGVSYLIEDDGKVVLNRVWLGDSWRASDPALRRK